MVANFFYFFLLATLATVCPSHTLVQNNKLTRLQRRTVLSALTTLLTTASQIRIRLLLHENDFANRVRHKAIRKTTLEQLLVEGNFHNTGDRENRQIL